VAMGQVYLKYFVTFSDVCNSDDVGIISRIRNVFTHIALDEINDMVICHYKVITERCKCLHII